MKERKRLTFKSWENSCDRSVRAIALCDSDDYFSTAINCLRDSHVCDKDDNGVYIQQWSGDSVWPEEKKTLLPATINEVELYLSYVDINEVVKGFDDDREVRIIELNTIRENEMDVTYVEIEIRDIPCWKRLLNYLIK